MKRKKTKANKKLRDFIDSAGLAQWEAGELLGYTESVFSRKIRKELPEDEQEKMIAELKKEMTNRGLAVFIAW